MPQVKAKVDWFKNTHLPPPPIEPVRIDNSDALIENCHLEETKHQSVQHIHLQKHQAFLDRNEVIKAARKNMLKYHNVKQIIQTKDTGRYSCSQLVRRSKCYADLSKSMVELGSGKLNHESPMVERSTSSWSYVSRKTSPDHGLLPHIPFAHKPIRMRHIPSIKPELITNEVFKGGFKSGTQFLRRRQSDVLKQTNAHSFKSGRSYQKLKELSDINKLGETDNAGIQDKVLDGKRHILGNYNDSLKDKIALFHDNIDKFKENNNNTNNKIQFAYQMKYPPRIY